MKNGPRALKIAMDMLEGDGRVIESVLVIPGAQGNKALVSFGVDGEVDDDWEAEAERLQGLSKRPSTTLRRGAARRRTSGWVAEQSRSPPLGYRREPTMHAQIKASPDDTGRTSSGS